MQFNDWRTIGAALCFAVAMYGCLRANFAAFRIVDLVNRQVGPDEQESMLGWGWTKTRRVFSRYRAFYPDGDLIRRYWLHGGVMFVGMIGVAISIGFFDPR
ncbi:hypothetical protein [Caulobacter sp. 17J65-9]|uniref:hypothetical protein n=1 Tax=Caulobacter sp. 17J65-9 TaxID=2709382 RepID=UPI0013CC98A3|nr:hypothetical protein [Caulobacter sp. 17J65-9]NEX94863.1 hypothetical protein [Caulobacter sp. 17J65-9]